MDGGRDPPSFTAPRHGKTRATPGLTEVTPDQEGPRGYHENHHAAASDQPGCPLGHPGGTRAGRTTPDHPEMLGSTRQVGGSVRARPGRACSATAVTEAAAELRGRSARDLAVGSLGRQRREVRPWELHHGGAKTLAHPDPSGDGGGGQCSPWNRDDAARRPGAREAIRHHKIPGLVHVPPPSQPCAGNSLGLPGRASRQMDLSRDRRAQPIRAPRASSGEEHGKEKNACSEPAASGLPPQCTGYAMRDETSPSARKAGGRASDRASLSRGARAHHGRRRPANRSRGMKGTCRATAGAGSAPAPRRQDLVWPPTDPERPGAPSRAPAPKTAGAGRWHRVGIVTRARAPPSSRPTPPARPDPTKNLPLQQSWHLRSMFHRPAQAS
ncbi:hypothetical protein PVAP13_6NG274303 [Panicum virgatum]|uniref:Uncharacterized protein n=1 Tax=Panicum virgatum TaxID=38727 RepID=A0A8T0R293_PANVG|nr:hypothetical protein PVAP13_6NG274303 [Panicum virgatum]